MKYLKIRRSEPVEYPIFQKFLEETSMETPLGKIRKIFRSNPLELLGVQRNAPLNGYIFESLADASCIGIATDTFYSRDSVKELGIETDFETVHYLAELRVDPKSSRRARLEWKSAYRELIDLHQAPALTAVLDENLPAIRSFGSGREGIRYLPLVAYTSFVVLGVSSQSGNPDHFEEWLLEDHKGTRRELFLSSCYPDQILSWVPSTSESLVFAVVREKEIAIEVALKEKQLNYLKIPATLYEVGVQGRPSFLRRVKGFNGPIPIKML